MTAEDLRRHLLEELLPLWAQRGIDRERGGFFNRILADLSPAPDDHKRLLVHARQLYAFSTAMQLGAGSWAREAAARALDFMNSRLRDSRRGGWYLTSTLAGDPLDTRKDLYAHAFVIFALASFSRAVGDPEPARQASQTFELLLSRLANASGGGFHELADADWRPLPGPRRQNPHMHLVEALLELHRATGEGSPLAAADELVQLFERRFIDPGVGCLGEVFAEDWRPLDGPQGRIVEPGHHFEWVWLLHRRAELGRRPVPESAEALFRFARRFGVDADGLVLDGVERDGRVSLDSKRLWPQTEYVKALAVRGELASMRSALEGCFAAYVEPAHRGWQEQLTRDGEVSSEAMNATSVYHVVLALTEAAERMDQSGSRSTLRN